MTDLLPTILDEKLPPGVLAAVGGTGEKPSSLLAVLVHVDGEWRRVEIPEPPK